jgi:hypothetical protein
MTSQIKKITQSHDDSRLLLNKSSAIEELLLHGLKEKVKLPDDEKDWQLIRVDEKKDVDYTDIAADKPGNVFHKAAQELEVALEIVFTFARNSGGSFSFKDDEDHYRNDQPDNPDDDDNRGGGKRPRRPNPVIFTTVQNSAQESSEQNLSHMIRYAENPLIRLRELPQLETLQHEIMPHILEIPSLPHRLPFIFALGLAAPANSTYVSEAVAMLASDYSFNAESTPYEKQIAGLAQTALQDPAFMEKISYAVTHLPHHHTTAHRTHVSQSLAEQAMINMMSDSKLDTAAATQLPPSEEWKSGSRISATQFAQAFKSIPFSHALFLELQEEILRTPELAYTEGYDLKRHGMPTATKLTDPQPTSSFYRDLGLTAGEIGDLVAADDSGSFSSN